MPRSEAQNNTKNIENCDSDVISTEIESKNSTYKKDETEQIEASNPSDSESIQLKVEKEKSGEDFSNLSPSTLKNDNANSAFEVSTFYV